MKDICYINVFNPAQKCVLVQMQYLAAVDANVIINFCDASTILVELVT